MKMLFTPSGGALRTKRPVALLTLAVVQIALIALPHPGIQSVQSSSPPAASGQWSPVMNWPLVAIHMELLPTGDVLAWDGWQADGDSARLWKPDSQAFVAVPEAYTHIFCAGQVALADGRVFVIGGHNGADTGITDTNLFNPMTSNWTHTANMHVARWYPSATLLGDGRVLALGGEITAGVYADVPEVYDPAANVWSQLTAPAARLNVDEYPNTYVLSNGKAFMSAGPDGISRTLDIAKQNWATVGPNPVRTGTTAMYRPGKIISAGGDTNNNDPVVSATAVIDLNQPSPAWRQTAPMTFSRDLHNLVLLPDGKVLAVGGSTESSLISTAGRLEAEMWDPATETWTTMASMHDLRMYHSTALLLPDGRVLVAGGGRVAPATDYLTAEIYSPPYLFQGARPTIANAPTTTTYAAPITVQTPDAANIASVSLIRLSAVTHTFNMDQRFIDLSFTKGAGALTVQSPANANSAPPGYYMLFIVNTSGVPSVAKIVQVVSHTSSVTLTAPSSGAIVSGPSVPLSATTVDDVGVANLQFFLDGNPIGPSLTGLPYTMMWDSTSVADGPHQLSVQMHDILGNVITTTPMTVTVRNVLPLAVAGIAPSSGVTTGGSVVTITGTGFQRGASVTFGNVEGTNVTVANSTTLMVTTPSHSAGNVSVVVANPDGHSVTVNGGYAYGTVNPLPSGPPSALAASPTPNPLPMTPHPTAPTIPGGPPAARPPPR